jgi:iron complex transport system substrate-binding protein
MNMRKPIFGCIFLSLYLLTTFILYAGGSEEVGVEAFDSMEVIDGMGRTVEVPKDPERVICSGAGCLRLLVYLRAQNRIVAVDDMEKSRPMFRARPYSLANQQFNSYPLFGEFRGHDNPELIAGLDPQPDLIFKTYGRMGYSPEELQDKTGIPVVVLNYGDLLGGREDLYQSLRTMGRILGETERAEEVIAFFDDTIADLDGRTGDVPGERKKSCYVGGIAFKGPHGLQSTEPAYPPFLLINAKSVAYDPDTYMGGLSHADVAKEKIVEWDPEYLFVDLATIHSGEASGALYELENDPAFKTLSAVKQGRVFGVLPYNWYTQNFGNTFAVAYFIGSVIYPDQFSDIDPAEKADDIYTFLVGAPVFDEMNSLFQNLVFKRIVMED